MLMALGSWFYIEDTDNFHAVYADDDNRWHLVECVDGGTTEIMSGAILESSDLPRHLVQYSSSGLLYNF